MLLGDLPAYERRLSMRIATFIAALFALGQVCGGQENQQPLTPEEAGQKFDQTVTVQLQVRSSGGNRNRYLNSAASYESASNFTIFISEATVKKFAEVKIERPEEYFYGKTVRVTGKVTPFRLRLLGQESQRPQIAVTDPTQIKVIENLSGPTIHKRSHVYKRVGALSIRADSYRFHDRADQPVVVWIHGGALMLGHRESVPRWLMDAGRENGWVIVSLDYRLAPETMLPEIVADIEDAFKWIRESGPELFQADAKRIAVVGGSAGGYLTLMSGFRVEPRPQGLVSLWGYGDLIGPWYSQPSPHHKSTMTA